MHKINFQVEYVKESLNGDHPSNGQGDSKRPVKFDSPKGIQIHSNDKEWINVNQEPTTTNRNHDSQKVNINYAFMHVIVDKIYISYNVIVECICCCNRMHLL